MKKIYKSLSFMRAYDSAVWIQFTGTILSALTMFMIRPFLVLYLHDRMEGAVLLPILIVTLQPLCGMVAGIGGGTWSDRFGRKPVLLVSMLLQTVSMAGYAIADSIVLFALASVVNGVGSALFEPAASALVSDVVKEEQRAEVYALLHMAFNVGAAIGPALGLMLFTWNVHLVFWLATLLLGLYSLLLWTRLRIAAPPASRKSNPRSDLCRHPLFKSREMRIILLLTLCYLPLGFLYAQVSSTLPFHLQTQFSNYKAVLTLLLTFNGITVIVLQLWIARATARFPAYKMLGIAYALFGLAAIGYGYAPSLLFLLITELMFSVGEMLHGPHIRKAISDIAPEKQLGYVFAVFGLGAQLTRTLGPLAGGIILNQWGGSMLFTILMLVFLVVGGWQFRLMYAYSARQNS